MIRFFDILFSLFGIIFLSPLFIILSFWIALESKGGVFFRQVRVGKNGKDFKLIKFRSMRPDSESKGQLTVGSRDPRITNSGYFIRKYKLDELPQLFNVLKGEMSLVGPRPEVRKYVDLYTVEQARVLSVRPGITDLASLQYFEESDLLEASDHPEQTYIKEIMPAKLQLNQAFIEHPTLSQYFSIIFKTIARIFS